MMDSLNGTCDNDVFNELERLTRELDQANCEVVVSAQYGLVLLEEKNKFEQRCEELEALYENSKHELNITQEALAKFQSSHKVITKTNIETEDSLITKSAAREASLHSKIIELENEIKQYRRELERVTAERDCMLQENNDMGKDKDYQGMECKKLRTELREVKFRENLLITDYSELEEENIALQKQLYVLKRSQVEFESLKLEKRLLHEKMELMSLQLEEWTNLKRIAEKHIEEVLKSLQSEREAKYALKRELDQQINRESFCNINNLAYSMRYMTEKTNVSDCEEDIHIEDGLCNENILELASSDDKQVNLFSELHLNELRKLENQLELLEKDKNSLTQSLRENQGLAEKSQGELQVFMARLTQMAAHVDSLQCISQTMYKNIAKPVDEATKELAQYQQWFKMSCREIEQLKKDIGELEKLTNVSDVTLQLRTEITNLKNNLLDTELKSMDLDGDLKVLREFAREALASLDETQNNVQKVSEELSQLYHLVCMVNVQIPTRDVLDHEKEGMTPMIETAPIISDMSKIELLRSQLKSDIPLHDLETLNDTAVLARKVSAMVDQMNQLRNAIESTVELSKVERENRHGSYESFRDDSSKSEIHDLQEQVSKLKSLLSTKREQITTLRSILKSNENTAEVKLTNLKDKYENEKANMSETVMTMRSELRYLREELAMYSNLPKVKVGFLQNFLSVFCDTLFTAVANLMRRIINFLVCCLLCFNILSVLLQL